MMTMYDINVIIRNVRSNSNWLFMKFFFFFSSRRRHTRFDCDWSSDVCSSDLSNRSESVNLRHGGVPAPLLQLPQDRKSTRLNSSHSQISYAVFCLKKKKGRRSGGWFEPVLKQGEPNRDVEA